MEDMNLQNQSLSSRRLAISSNTFIFLIQLSTYRFNAYFFYSKLSRDINFSVFKDFID